MDAVISQLQDVVEGQIDFKGQQLAETLSTALLSLTTVVALAAGFAEQDIYLTMLIGLAGTLLTMFAVVPPWPVYNMNPQPFLGSALALPSGGITIGGLK